MVRPLPGSTQAELLGAWNNSTIPPDAAYFADFVRTRLRTSGNPMCPEGAMPVYYPSEKGLEFLACHFNDDRFLRGCCLTPNWQHLAHWVAVAQFHMMLDDAIALQTTASLGGWLGEWDVANPDAKDPAGRYRLYTLLSENPRQVCNPDLAFLLQVGGYSKVYYGEIDRNTCGLRQICMKAPGFAAMAERQLHRRHFQANTSSFFVLHVSPTVPRRDAVCRAIADKPGAALWKFASLTDLRPDTLLYESVWLRCDGEVQPLIKRLPSPTGTADAGSGMWSGGWSGARPPGTASSEVRV